MRYNSLINNVKSLEWGLNVSEAYIFSWMYELPSWANEVSIGGKIWYFASKTKAVEEMPILTTKLDTMYRYYKSLESKGLIEIMKISGKDYICLTDKGKCWNDIKSECSDKNPSVGNKSEYSEINPAKLGKFSENHSDLNPTYNTTILDNIIIDNNNSLKQKFELFRVSYPGVKKGLNTEFENLKKRHKDYKEIILSLTENLKKQKESRAKLKNAGKFVPPWKNLQTYINQRAWEEEIGGEEIAPVKRNQTSMSEYKELFGLK